LLLTRPLTELQIVLAKYFAGVVLVIVSLLPTLIYYYSVHQLGYPKGNVDTGGMWGSYIGLLFLGAGFVCSWHVCLCHIRKSGNCLYYGLTTLLYNICRISILLHPRACLANTTAFVKGLGMNEHYM
jgi:ABC-type transport system involved in multi-copper enzyme maturation permease subunit